MSQYQQDSDKTVFLGINDNASTAVLPPSIQPVAGATSSGHRHGNSYVAQQTSLEEFTPGLNPLVNAAASLLLEIVHLRDGGRHSVAGADAFTASVSSFEDDAHSYNTEALRARLEAEVRAFEAQALAAEIDSSQVLAARYVMCTAVDEAIGRSHIGESGEWSRLALLSTFHNETWGGEKFFNILDKCMQQPARNLYILELMYLLLSLGFEGKYHVLDRGPIALESLRDKLYRQIRLLRGEPNPDLAKKTVSGAALKNRRYTFMPLWMLASIVIVCVGVTFFGFSQILDNKAAPALEQIYSFAPDATGANGAPAKANRGQQ